jgi:hypothetical protein
MSSISLTVIILLAVIFVRQLGEKTEDPVHAHKELRALVAEFGNLKSAKMYWM